jgi:hypothetical protein
LNVIKKNDSFMTEQCIEITIFLYRDAF